MDAETSSGVGSFGILEPVVNPGARVSSSLPLMAKASPDNDCQFSSILTPKNPKSCRDFRLCGKLLIICCKSSIEFTLIHGFFARKSIKASFSYHTSVNLCLKFRIRVFGRSRMRGLVQPGFSLWDIDLRSTPNCMIADRCICPGQLGQSRRKLL